MRPSLAAGSLPLLALALLLTGCPGNKQDEFPLAVGFQPLEAISGLATFPAATIGDAHPQGLGNIVQVLGFSHYTSHAVGYVHAPLDRVYAALKVPAASYIHNANEAGPQLTDPPFTMGVEQFPVSFVVHYVNDTVIGKVYFDVTYRAGPLEGTELAPLKVGLRYQKTSGIENIKVMAGSLVAYPVEGDAGVTAVEMIAWLDATGQTQADCDGTLTDLYGDLLGVLATLPP